MEMSSYQGRKLSPKSIKEMLILVIIGMQLLENTESTVTAAYRKFPQRKNVQSQVNIYPVLRVEDVTHCAMHCNYERDCSFFKYSKRDCKMFHTWKDDIYIENESESTSYYLVEDYKWHKVVYLEQNASINLDFVFNAANHPRDYLPSRCQDWCPDFYRSGFASLWHDLPIDQVKVVLYKHGVEVVNVLFTGNGSRLSTWFNGARLLNSPWVDLNEDSTIATKFAVRRQYPNTFFIAKHDNVKMCDSNSGWLLIGYSDTCSWAPQNTVPYMIYSDKPHKTKWSEGYGTADAFKVFISLIPENPLNLWP